MKTLFCICCFLLEITQLAQAQTWQWARTLHRVSVTATATHSSGDVYVAGHFNAPINFTSPYFGGTLTLTPVGVRDLFIARLDASGNLKWARQVGGAGATAYGNAISPDNSGGVYVAGSFLGTLTVNTGGAPITASPVYTAMLLLRCTAAGGTTLWSRKVGNSSYYSTGATVAAQPGGGCFVGGIAGGGTLTFAPISVSAPNRTGYVAAYTAAGSASWVKLCQYSGGPVGTIVNKVATDGAGNCYATGFYTTVLSLGGLTLPNVGTDRQTFVARLNPTTGAGIWLRGTTAAAAGSTSRGTGLSVYGGQCYAGGNFNGTTAFGSGYTLLAGSPNTGYLASYSTATGSTAWVRPLGYATTGVAVGANISRVVAGLGIAGSPDKAKLSSYAPTGTFQWSQTAYGRQPCSSADVALLGSAVYWSGSFSEACIFGPLVIWAPAGAPYGFLTKLNVVARTARAASEVTTAAHPQLEIYPNPVASELHITRPGADAEPLNLTVYTAFGTPVLRTEVGADGLTLDVRTWARGTYWLTLEGSGTHERRQLRVE